MKDGGQCDRTCDVLVYQSFRSARATKSPILTAYTEAGPPDSLLPTRVILRLRLLQPKDLHLEDLRGEPIGKLFSAGRHYLSSDASASYAAPIKGADSFKITDTGILLSMSVKCHLSWKNLKNVPS
jgi:hypothetical protein